MIKVKLIRDKATAAGQLTQHVNTSAGKHILLLLEMHKSAQAIADAPGTVEPYADMLQCLHSMAKLQGVSWDEVIDRRLTKAQELGEHRMGLILIEGNNK